MDTNLLISLLRSTDRDERWQGVTIAFIHSQAAGWAAEVLSLATELDQLTPASRISHGSPEGPMACHHAALERVRLEVCRTLAIQAETTIREEVVL